MTVENQTAYDVFVPESANYALDPQLLKNNGPLLLGRNRWEWKDLWIEEKYDGSLYMGRSNGAGLTFTSRRTSEKNGKPVDKTDNLPFINKWPKSLDGTLVIGEVMSPTKDHGDVNRLMNSLPEKSKELQTDKSREDYIGIPTYIAFDVVWFKGQDLRMKSITERRKYRDEVVDLWQKTAFNPADGEPLVYVSTIWNGTEALLRYAKIVKEGGEGLMVKHRNMPYGQGIIKVKKCFDCSVFVIGYEDAKEGKTGKFKGQIGAIKFAVLHKGEPVQIGQCSGMVDEIRRDISAHRDKYLGAVLDVRCQPFDHPEYWKPEEEKLRHPRFLRFRTDWSKKQCTSDKLRSDMEAAAQGRL